MHARSQTGHSNNLIGEQALQKKKGFEDVLHLNAVGPTFLFFLRSDYNGSTQLSSRMRMRFTEATLYDFVTPCKINDLCCPITAST